MTSNQHYGGINNRFDKRAKRLHKLGFVYERIEEFGIAVFTKTNTYDRKRKTMPAAFVMMADKRTWIDELASKLTRSY